MKPSLAQASLALIELQGHTHLAGYFLDLFIVSYLDLSVHRFAVYPCSNLFEGLPQSALVRPDGDGNIAAVAPQT